MPGLPKCKGQPTEAVDQAHERLPVVRYESVEINQMADPVSDVLKRAGDNEAPVGKAEQHDVVQVFIQDLVRDIQDVRGEIDLRAAQVRALAQAGQAGCEHLVPCCAQ